jgi:hypothetical protein
MPSAASTSGDRPPESVIVAVKLLREAILSLLRRGEILDVAFIGSASTVYEWIPSRIVDFDAFIFVDRLDRDAGNEIQRVQEDVRRRLDVLDVDFELRIIEGAYKPQRSALQRPIVLAHLGVFDERLYLNAPVVKRWSWRKYPCEKDVERLDRLCPRKPTALDLLREPSGVADTLNDLRRGTTSMLEWKLPDLHTEELCFDCESHVFVEFCHGAAATTARHHARLLDRDEADRLGNDKFFPWYNENVLRTSSLLPLMELKARSRNGGFGDVGRSRALAINFLEAVQRRLIEMVGE